MTLPLKTKNLTYYGTPSHIFFRQIAGYELHVHMREKSFPITGKGLYFYFYFNPHDFHT